MVSEMGFAERLEAPNILSLPRNLVCDIGSWLDERGVCNLELASKKLYESLSRPSRTGRCEWWLDLSKNAQAQPVSPKALRSSTCVRKCLLMLSKRVTLQPVLAWVCLSAHPGALQDALQVVREEDLEVHPDHLRLYQRQLAGRKGWSS